ncbi:MAG TPA: SIS domain-containing protein [Acidimicrobiales bacterium]|nr:SIS domain-containing protein [Acidimicrobiales bacterium]
MLDTASSIEAAARLPGDLTEALRTPFERTGPPPASVGAVLVVGVGPDATAGEMLAAAGSDELLVPVVVSSRPDLPGFVGPRTLVVVVAGATGAPEASLAARAAIERGSELAVVAPRGEVADRAAGAGATVRIVAPGAGSRGALGTVLGELLAICDRWGVWPGAVAAGERAVGELSVRRDTLTGGDGGEARAASRRIGATFAVVHGAAGIGAVAARRWTEQIATCAKSPAFAGSEPARSAGSIAGFGQHGDVTRQILTLVELRSDDEGPILARRFAAAAELAREAVADVVEVRARGTGPLAQLLDLVLVGDFVALQLAAAAGVDPGPVPAVDDVAREIATR